MFGPAHVDVVPVENVDAWSEDPFSGVVKEGYVWGRGALDMLFIVAAQVQAFIALHGEGFQPKGDLILLVVSDEEAGGPTGLGGWRRITRSLSRPTTASRRQAGFASPPVRCCS
ncbi:M20/M25/M40 family metallo-hydrolase [Candidatus Bathyarchaeota archaeon]|nr:M20/M25/M40 family metallo-hydrolase [Candidatus Bathyarchaeota archaeon]